MFKLIVLFTFVTCFSSAYLKAHLQITELSSSNGGTYYDEDGKTPDWIELQNISSESVNLKNWRIYDKDNYSSAFILPDTVVKPNEYIIIHASDKNKFNRSNTIVSTNNGFITHYTATDDFDYYCNSYEKDFELRINIKSIKSSHVFGKAGLMLREELNNDSKFYGIFAQSKQSRKYLFLVKEELSKNPMPFESDYSLNYPDLWLMVKREKDSIITAITDETGFILFKNNFFYEKGKNIFAGFAIAGNGSNTHTQAIIGDIFLNKRKITIDELNYISIGQNRSSNFYFGGEIHTSFKLSSNGGKVCLWDTTGAKVDEIVFPKLKVDYSFGRDNLNRSSLEFYTKPTPESDNINGFPAITESPEVTHNSGFYDEIIKIQFLYKDINSTIYYTLDGSDIDIIKSKKFVGEDIFITKNTVLKAKAIKDGEIPSETIKKTYFIKERFNLPTISIIADSLMLFGELGVFHDLNLFMRIEKEITFEYWKDKSKVAYSANAGIQLTGETSIFLSQKSFRLYARDNYGSDEFNFNFFNKKGADVHYKLWFRSASNDWKFSLLRDPFANAIVDKSVYLNTPAYQPVAIFINGKYWGIYQFKEYIDEELIANRNNISENSINLLERNGIPKNGTSRTFEEFSQFIDTLDFSNPEVYKIIEDNVDTDNLIDYIAVELFVANSDWGATNIKYWQSRELDNKWRWIMHDLDQAFPAFTNASINSFQYLFAADSRIGKIMEKFLQNNEFKNKFLNRTADLLNSLFHPHSTNKILDSFVNKISIEIPFHQQRWEGSAVEFESQIAHIKNFLNERNDHTFAHFAEQFDLSGTYWLNIENADTSAGYVQVNSLSIEDSKWTGRYFNDVPISVTAIPKSGFKFISWQSDSLLNIDTLYLYPNELTELKPIFVPDNTNEAIDIVINEIMYKPLDSKDSKDWFELYNPNEIDIDLSGWSVMDDNDKNKYILPEFTVIKAKDYLVLAESINKFNEIYPDVDNVIGSFDFGLSASGDKIRLFDKNNNLIDIVEFLPTEPWDSKANGTGASLELIHFAWDNNIGQNWNASIVDLGTPGSKNSTFTSVATSFNSNISYQIYPIPAKNFLNAIISSEKNIFVYINIIDFNGITIKEIANHIEVNNYPKIIPINLNMNNGTYFLQIKERYSGELIKNIKFNVVN